MNRSLFPVLLAAVSLLGAVPTVHAWGTHNQITAWALEVVPEADAWQKTLGAGNWRALIDLSWLPDQLDQDFSTYYTNDYLLNRAFPRHPYTASPEVKATFGPAFRRALQALRTETPLNAVRQMGPLLHYIQDAGSPAHVKEVGRYHPELENWAPCNANIRDYQPRLLGNTEAEAVAGLTARMDGVIAKAIEVRDRASPGGAAPSTDRTTVDPLLLDAGKECARATADVIYTAMKLGLAAQATGGAGLEGTVTAPEFPLLNQHGARVVLLNTDFCTLATTAAGDLAKAGWRGEYRFRNLPAGTYRLLAYRTAARPFISEPVTLVAGTSTRQDLALAPTEPLGNVVENPDGKLSYLEAGQPDRWRRLGGAKTPTWMSMPIRLTPGASYRCGAALSAPEARARLAYRGLPARSADPLTGPDGKPVEVRFRADAAGAVLQVLIESPKPLTEVLGNAWVVPEPATAP